jgi:broad specificity phosphatase PhoE
MERRILLARHGECLSAVLSDSDLILRDEEDGITERGKTQARELAHALLSLTKRARLVTSPLRRALETAIIVSEETGWNFMKEAALREAELCFPAETTVARAKEIQLSRHLMVSELPFEGESLAKHRRRVWAWAKREIESSNGDLVIIAHGGTIDQLQYWLFRCPPDISAHVYTKCDFGSYHLWHQSRVSPDETVFRLDAVNVSPFARYLVE